MKVSIKRTPLQRQDYRKKYEHLEDIFEQLRSDYWLTRDSLDKANKRIELLESLCDIHGISIPKEIPF
jgi:hypothetical protein